MLDGVAPISHLCPDPLPFSLGAERHPGTSPCIYILWLFFHKLNQCDPDPFSLYLPDKAGTGQGTQERPRIDPDLCQSLIATRLRQLHRQGRGHGYPRCPGSIDTPASALLFLFWQSCCPRPLPFSYLKPGRQAAFLGSPCTPRPCTGKITPTFLGRPCTPSNPFCSVSPSKGKDPDPYLCRIFFRQAIFLGRSFRPRPLFS